MLSLPGSLGSQIVQPLLRPGSGGAALASVVPCTGEVPPLASVLFTCAKVFQFGLETLAADRGAQLPVKKNEVHLSCACSTSYDAFSLFLVL